MPIVSRRLRHEHQTRVIGLALCALSAAACGDGGDTNTSTVTGTVTARGDSASRVAGAAVAVHGTSLSTMTDANGAFTLQNVPHGDVFFVTDANGHWGTVDYYYVPDETAGVTIDLGVVPDAAMSAIAESLGRSLSASDGIVDVIFFSGAQGGETASIDVPSDPPFTFDLDGNAVAQAGVIADDEGYGELVYTSVATADGPITADVVGVDGVTVCQVEETPGITLSDPREIDHIRVRVLRSRAVGHRWISRGCDRASNDARLGRRAGLRDRTGDRGRRACRGSRSRFLVVEPAPVQPGHVPIIVEPPSEPPYSATEPREAPLPPMSEEDAYRHAVLSWRSLKTRNILIGSSVATAVGVALVFPAEFTQCGDTGPEGEMTLNRCSPGGKAMVVIGYPLLLVGGVAMIASGIVLGVSNGQLRRFEQRASRRRTRALRWDPARSGFVF